MVVCVCVCVCVGEEVCVCVCISVRCSCRVSFPKDELNVCAFDLSFARQMHGAAGVD